MGAHARGRRRGERTDIIVDGLIAVSAAALIGGRAYHVIDQWAYYKDHLANIVLPPYSGLGVYGGIFTGMLVTIYLSRRWRLDWWRWGDMIVLAMLAAQTVGRWGNFMNQELYGPPTNLPWGIAIQCQYRVAEFACPAFGGTTPVDAHFHPLFLYESLLSLLGFFVLLWIWNHFTARGRVLIAGDVGLLYFVWYGVERSLLETLRGGWNWTFQGIPVAQIVGLGAAALAVLAIVRQALVGEQAPACSRLNCRAGRRSLIAPTSACPGGPETETPGATPRRPNWLSCSTSSRTHPRRSQSPATKLPLSGRLSGPSPPRGRSRRRARRGRLWGRAAQWRGSGGHDARVGGATWRGARAGRLAPGHARLGTISGEYRHGL